MSCRKELDYIRRRSSVQQAKNVNRGIQEAIKGLATFPARHQKMEQIGTEQQVYHSFPKWSFLIIYRVEEEVLRVGRSGAMPPGPQRGSRPCTPLPLRVTGGYALRRFHHRPSGGSRGGPLPT